MKKFEFDSKSLFNIADEMVLILDNIDNLLDDDEKTTASQNLIELEFEKFKLLLGRYMGKCLATVCEPFNESLYSVSLKKCVEIGFLPEISDEFYSFIGRVNPLSNSKNRISSEDISNFYKLNHSKLNMLQEHIFNTGNKYIKH